MIQFFVMIKLIIFDWDDVFTLGLKEGYIHCLHETLNRRDVQLRPEEELKIKHQTLR
jgi:hypothetical protein